MSLETLIFVGATLLLLLLLTVGYLARQRFKERHVRRRHAALVEAAVEVPPTLHPVFDPNLCIGSGSCTKVCPQGDDVIGLLYGQGALVDPTLCIGHGLCAAECPVHAIRLVFGTAERGVDIPMVSNRFETNVPGIFIAGELGGMGLIRNAVRQAMEAMEHIRLDLAAAGPERAPDGRGPEKAPDGPVEVVIVGAGPAGLTAALTALDGGLTYRLLEQEQAVGGSILHYPRRKIVLTETTRIPLLGTVFARTMLKEELVELWDRAIREHQLVIETGTVVRGVRRAEDGLFTLTTDRGEVRGRRVLLCVGRRGTPRKLGVPGEELGHVAYMLREPEVFRERRVLVVGGGDSAIEAACTLAEEVAARVTLSYRKGVLARIKPENRSRFERLLAEGRLAACWESAVQEIRPDAVRLKTREGEQLLPCDAVLIFAGGELPTALLTGCGVTMRRHFGEEAEEAGTLSSERVFGRIQDQARARGLLNRHQHEDSWHRWLAWGLALLGVGLVAGLFAWAQEYFLATPELREESLSLRPFLPQGSWGQSVGMLATFLILMNIAYFARKEFRIFKRFGDIHGWMQLHVFAGLTAVALTLLHSSLQLRNLYGAALYSSVGLVLFTGVIGRYLFGFVPLDPRGRPLAHAALESLADRLAKQHGGLFRRLAQTAQIQQVLDRDRELPTHLLWLLPRLLFTYPARFVTLNWLLHRARPELPDAQTYQELRLFVREMFRLRFMLDYLPHAKRLLGLWRTMHAVLAAFMILLILAHIGIMFWVGYRWIFT